MHKWVDVTAKEVKAFIAVEIAMGLMHKPSLDSYFSDGFFLTHSPGFSKIFSRDQYQLIRSCLHFVDNDLKNDDNDRLYKIKDVLDIVRDTYELYYVPHRELSVDETMVKFKGRIFFKQYLPKPGTRWGIKLWSLCDATTGYLLKFFVYTGKEDSADKDIGLGQRVVESLLEGYENKGHIVFTDNFYSGISLFESLRNKDIGACGTIRPHRKGLPLDIRTLKPKKGDSPIIWQNGESNLISCTWQDTGRVNMISTVGDVGTSNQEIKSKRGSATRTVCKPNINILYNKYMGGVDKFDQLCATYPFSRKSQKWYHTLWHFVIEASLVNGNILYNSMNKTKRMSQKKFREGVINGLLDGYEQRSLAKKKSNRLSNTTMRTRLVARHFVSQFEDKKHRPNCAVCCILPKDCKLKGKGSCKRRQTSYFCKKCPGEPPMCNTPCFEIYHTKKDYKAKCQCK